VTGRPHKPETAGSTGATDAQLLAAVSRLDQHAFAELLRRHHGPVYRLAWRVSGGREIDDIVQETFIKLWRNPGQVRDAALLRSWLMRVASNAAIDRGRQRQPGGLDEAPEVPDGRPTAETSLQRSAAANAVDAAIAGLPERQRLALALVHFEGLSNIEAARVMETTVEAMESLLSRGRRALKGMLAGQWRELLHSLAKDDA
jgi:RNA polymerase sigma-70 factor (ECF subfamily)